MCRQILTLVSLAGYIVLVLAIPAQAGSFSFQGLGHPLGGNLFPTGVSNDGTVAGYYYSWSLSGDNQALVWTRNGGMSKLGDLPGGAFESRAFDISADGSVIVGAGRSASGQEAFRWTNSGGMVGLGDLPGGPFSSLAWSVSADGSAIVGMSISPAFGQEAFRWTSQDGMVGLGAPPGGYYPTFAWDVSGDGLVVVGHATYPVSIDLRVHEAIRWTSADGGVGLGFLPGGSDSEAYAASADGSVVVGYGDSSSGGQAFRWTSQGGMVGLGDLAGGVFYSRATGVSANGDVVVGNSTSASQVEPFLWTNAGGMVGLRDYLANHKVTNLTGWTLQEATAVSADGNTIVGRGINPNGLMEPWIATIPEPTSFALACMALSALAVVAMQRRRAGIQITQSRYRHRR